MLPSKAYDLKMLTESVSATGNRGHGWCFGFPPGITQEQWPLDRLNGFPLKHAFTLLLPDEYRCHGPEIVALSFFGIAKNEHHDGGATPSPPIVLALEATEPPTDQLLRKLWHADRSGHPRTHRMLDILDCEYAAILLTQAEFEGPFCHPPDYDYPPMLYGIPRPRWLEVGTAFSHWEENVGSSREPPFEQLAIFRDFGQIPDKTLEFNRAVYWTPRATDPNAGKAPEETYGEGVAKSGYQDPHYRLDGKYMTHDWADGHEAMHIGGTMAPSQQIPQGFGPYYVEFEEILGGFNFGAGNAQLDFQNMKFDWACG